MSLFSRLFGGGGKSDSSASMPTPPPGRPVHRFSLTFGQRKRLGERSPAEQFLLAAGSWELYMGNTGAGAYAPLGAARPLPEGGWRNVIHMAICQPFYPLEEEAPEPPPTLPHRLFRNESEPGPFDTKSAAKNAFRSIPSEQRRFHLDAPARVLFWIEADQPSCDGEMRLALYRLS